MAGQRDWVHLSPAGVDRGFGQGRRKHDVQTAVPGVEVADLAIAEEQVRIGDRYLVAQPDGALRRVRDGTVALFDVGQRGPRPVKWCTSKTVGSSSLA